MKHLCFVPYFFGSLLIAACASQPVEPTVPATLVPPGEQVVERVAANGAQIYQCRATPGTGDGMGWVFVAPEAELFDARGGSAGKHYAGPHWEASDGSKIVGAAKARSDAPQAGAIPWLLLTAKSVGGEGRFSKVTSVQRINTNGGVAPTRACDAKSLGATERVPYTADYVMFSVKASAY